jgi:hypothetical protein
MGIGVWADRPGATSSGNIEKLCKRQVTQKMDVTRQIHRRKFEYFNPCFTQVARLISVTVRPSERRTVTITYGLAIYDRNTGKMDSDINLPMCEVGANSFPEFLNSAGENGWELCGTFSAGVVGSTRSMPGTTELRKCVDAAEEIAFVFKKTR